MRSTRRSGATLLLALGLLLGGAACGGDDDASDDPSSAPASSAEDGGDVATGDDGGSGEGGDTDVDEALAAQTPEGTVEVPSDAGATTIAEYVAGGSSFEPTDPEGLAQILALVGTTADGYITDDAVVIRGTEADATLWCGAGERLEIDYTIIPVLPDGTGVDCAS